LPADLKRIFKRFYRVPSPQTQKTKGTGLGLFIVRSIIKKHGGRISAESKGDGTGSTFIVQLPKISRSADSRSADGSSALSAKRE